MRIFSRAGKAAGKTIAKEGFQAAVAAGVLMAAADGKIDREETDKTVNIIAINDMFKSFSKGDIQKQVQSYANIITTDARMGKLKLLKEIEDVADNAELGEQIFITAISVGEASGDSLGTQEYAMLVRIGEIVGFKPEDYEVQAPA